VRNFLCALRLVPKLVYLELVLEWIGPMHPDAAYIAMDVALLKLNIEALLTEAA
jgi:hypothetical protein